MKTIILILSLFISQLFLSQNNEKKNELKINTGTLFNGRLDISYETKLGSHYSAGINTGVGFAERDYQKRKFLFKPFGRYFVNRKNDFRGFFVQASLLFYTTENLPVPSTESFTHSVGTYDYFGPTIGIGCKWVIAKKIPLEIYADIGPDLINKDKLLPFIGEAGISLGYRF